MIGQDDYSYRSEMGWMGWQQLPLRGGTLRPKGTQRRRFEPRVLLVHFKG